MNQLDPLSPDEEDAAVAVDGVALTDGHDVAAAPVALDGTEDPIPPPLF